ncbi:Flagellar hook-associated protein flgK [Burkholderia vietnamiensis]|nr:Flagellar hook-associated protein flgK [Burkholderia vietnamiensis]
MVYMRFNPHLIHQCPKIGNLTSIINQAGETSSVLRAACGPRAAAEHGRREIRAGDALPSARERAAPRGGRRGAWRDLPSGRVYPIRRLRAALSPVAAAPAPPGDTMRKPALDIKLNLL